MKKLVLAAICMTIILLSSSIVYADGEEEFAPAQITLDPDKLPPVIHQPGIVKVQVLNFLTEANLGEKDKCFYESVAEEIRKAIEKEEASGQNPPDQGFRMHAWVYDLNGNKYLGKPADLFGMNELNVRKQCMTTHTVYSEYPIRCPDPNNPSDTEVTLPYHCMEKLYNEKYPLYEYSGGYLTELGILSNNKKMKRISDFIRVKLPAGGILFNWIQGASHRRDLLGARYEIEKTGVKFHFYVTHLNTKDCHNCRIRGAEVINETVQEHYVAGDYPPIVVGDFNDGRDNEAKKTREEMHKNFNDVGRQFNSFKIDHIYYGKRSKFNGAPGAWKASAFVVDTQTKNTTTLANGKNVKISDHASLSAILAPHEGAYEDNTLVWYYDKYYKGKEIIKPLSNYRIDTCYEFDKNDKMKSLKYFGKTGWRLQIFDKKDCSKDDDWAEISFPYNSLVASVDVPRLDNPGVAEAVPAGSYDLHRVNGLTGDVSAFKVLPNSQPGKLIWYEKKKLNGESHQRALWPEDSGQCQKIKQDNKMKSFEFHAPEGSTLTIYDDDSCSEDNDYGIATIPSGAPFVKVRKIGKQHENDFVEPPGSYVLHYKNGITGEVSSFKFDK